MPRMTGGDAIVKSLIAHGVEVVFALPGVQNDALFNALFDAGDAIRVIHTRHEQGAAYMALGYAAATGKVGCYAVVPGPGFLNTTAALSTAYAVNAKVLCLTGQISSSFIGKGYGLLHELPDQLSIVRSLTKWAEPIASPADAPGKVAEAFRQLHTGRPRPVGLEVAMDVLAGEGEVELPPVEADYARPAVDGAAVARAAELLAGAERPLIFVGGGAQGASAEVQAVAELLQAPVIASPEGHGVLSSRHYLSHTMPVGHRLWPTADVVLAVGTRLAMPQMQWGLDEKLKIVRVDIDPEEPGRHAPPAQAIVADSKDGLAALLPRLEALDGRRADRKEEMEALKGEMAESFAKLEPQVAYLKAIRAALPDDGIFVSGLTQIGYVAYFAMPVYQPRTYLSSGYQGTLGWAFASALGARVGRPETPVVAVVGDGGFLFNAQELATAVQNRLAVVALVFNDGAYGNVKRMQKELYGGRMIASELHNPDYVALAESFGAKALRAEDPDQLQSAMAEGVAHDGPTVIEIPVGEMPAPWHHVVMPRVRGEGKKG